MVVVPVALGERAYSVHISAEGAGDASTAFDGLYAALVQRFGSRPAVVVTDSHVAPLWAAHLVRALGGVQAEIVLPAGEVHKTLDVWAGLVGQLLAAAVDRHTPVIALGGGVIGDLVGFAAATTLRGLPLVQVPTTLLAMVDSSVGGKTAVNHPLGKNLIGAFHQPSLVWASLHTLSTLPEGERLAGLGEVVKTALIEGEDFLAELEAAAPALRAGDPAALAPVIARCVAAKARVVAADERESGVRAWLNAGHTVGHGLETALGHGVLRHGEAVALGLVAEARWAVRAGVCLDLGLPSRLEALHAALGLPVRAPPFDRAAALAAMRLDKKSDRGTLALPVPSRAGKIELAEVPLAHLSALLSECQ